MTKTKHWTESKIALSYNRRPKYMTHLSRNNKRQYYWLDMLEAAWSHLEPTKNESTKETCHVHSASPIAIGGGGGGGDG